MKKMNCEKCGKEIVRKTAYQKYCVKCSYEINKQQTIENRKKRLTE